MKQLIPQEIIEKRIFVIHGQKIMLSMHLAELYGIETGILNQAVKRNINGFSEDFIFKLNNSEANCLVSQAAQVNIAIMRAFVKLREILSTHKNLAYKLRELERKIEKHGKDIKSIFEAIYRLMSPPRKTKMGNGFSL
jgi:hypothetical protein